jgi:uncharacterized protein YegP (UPF0339 family)
MASTFLIKDAHGGGYVWHLTADNNEIIAQSEVYKQKASCRTGIAAVKKDAPNAPIKDVSKSAGLLG